MSEPNALPPTGFVRKPVVLSLVPFGNTKLYEEIKRGRFPAPVRLSERVVVWRVEDIRSYIASKARHDVYATEVAEAA